MNHSDLPSRHSPLLAAVALVCIAAPAGCDDADAAPVSDPGVAETDERLEQTDEFDGELGEDERAIQFAVDSHTDLPADVRVGDRVDLWSVVDVPMDGDRDGVMTMSLMQNIPIVDVEESPDSSGSASPELSSVTFALTPDEAEAVLLARRTAQLRFALRHPDDVDQEAIIRTVLPRELEDLDVFQEDRNDRIEPTATDRQPDGPVGERITPGHRVINVEAVVPTDPLVRPEPGDRIDLITSWGMQDYPSLFSRYAPDYQRGAVNLLQNVEVVGVDSIQSGRAVLSLAVTTREIAPLLMAEHGGEPTALVRPPGDHDTGSTDIRTFEQMVENANAIQRLRDTRLDGRALANNLFDDWSIGAGERAVLLRRDRLNDESIRPSAGDWIDVVAIYPDREGASSPEDKHFGEFAAGTILQRVKVLAAGEEGITVSATPREAQLLTMAGEVDELTALERPGDVDDTGRFDSITRSELYDTLDRRGCCALPPDLTEEERKARLEERERLREDLEIIRPGD